MRGEPNDAEASEGMRVLDAWPGLVRQPRRVKEPGLAMLVPGRLGLVRGAGSRSVSGFSREGEMKKGKPSQGKDCLLISIP